MQTPRKHRAAVLGRVQTFVAVLALGCGIVTWIALGPSLGSSRSIDDSAVGNQTPAHSPNKSAPESGPSVPDRLPVANPDRAISSPPQGPAQLTDPNAAPRVRIRTMTVADLPVAVTERARHDGRTARLEPGQDAATRLVAAREILADSESSTADIGSALTALGQLNPSAAAQELRRRVASITEYPRDAISAANAIGELSTNTDALGAAELTLFFQSDFDEVRAAAARASEAQGDSALSAEFRREQSAALASDLPHQRIKAIANLARLGSPVALEDLRPLLHDADENVRIQAMESMHSIAGDLILDHIRPLLRDNSENVRRSAQRIVALHNAADED